MVFQKGMTRPKKGEKLADCVPVEEQTSAGDQAVDKAQDTQPAKKTLSQAKLRSTLKFLDEFRIQRKSEGVSCGRRELLLAVAKEVGCTDYRLIADALDVVNSWETSQMKVRNGTPLTWEDLLKKFVSEIGFEFSSASS